MNLMVLAVIGILAIFFVLGCTRGFAKMVLSACSTIIALILCVSLAPVAKNIVAEKTTWEADLATVIENTIVNSTLNKEEVQTEIQKIKNAEATPETVEQEIAKIENSVREEAKKISKDIAGVVISVAIYVLLMVVFSILLSIVGQAVGVVTKIPVIHQLNGLLGGALGLVEGLLLVWLIIMIIKTFSSTSWGIELYAMIEESKFLMFFCNLNPLSFLSKEIEGLSILDSLKDKFNTILE